MSDPKLIGRYVLGQEFVALLSRKGQGGEFFATGIKGIDEPCIIIGMGRPEFVQVFDTLIHEAMEAALVRVGCHYSPTMRTADDTSQAVMFMTHSQFSEAASRAAMFILQAQEPLNKRWEKRRG